MARIVVFGATGYTGRLVAEALVREGERPVLSGRDVGKLEALGQELGGLPTAVADVRRPDSVRALVEAGDVLVSTVGPFSTYGEPALLAAIDAKASYLDSTGEPPFVRRVFEELGPKAAGSCGLVTAFGYDYVPGNLAGALALEKAGPSATSIAVGYFLTGSAGAGAMSTGTMASAAGVLLESSFAWRDGRLQDERSARRVRGFTVEGRSQSAVSVGGSEHFALPRLFPALREVSVHLGWFGPLAPAIAATSALNEVMGRLPGARALVRSFSAPLTRRTGGGPDAAARSASRSVVVGVASDDAGTELATVTLEGPNGYTVTGDLLAWGAKRAAAHGLAGTGALGPIEAFGDLGTLTAGATSVGLLER